MHPRFAIDGKGPGLSNPAMDLFLRLARQLFRASHGLPAAEAPEPAPERNPEWIAWARRHRLTGLMATALADPNGVLRREAFGRARHAAVLTREAERIHALLSSRLPSVSLIKGPALAAQAWAQPGLRSYDDLDFVCPCSGYPLLLAGMQQAGYVPEASDPRQMEHLWHFGWGVAFRHPEGFRVEANHRFFPPQYPWPRRLSVTRPENFILQRLDAADLRAPAPALHLLLCCEHAVWHGWNRLAWIADVAGLLVRHPGIVPAAGELADGCPFARQTLAATCALADHLFGPGLSPTPLPDPGAVPAGVPAADGSWPVGRALPGFHGAFMTRRERAVYHLRRAFIPGDNDFRALSLPSALRGLYWLSRPVRIALARG